MDLPKEFQSSIDDAIARHGTNRDGWDGLHQVIAGPLPLAKKTALARRYGQELLNRGFVIDKPLFVSQTTGMRDEDTARYFNGGRGRVMVISVESETPQNRFLLQEISRAAQDQGSIIVLTGTGEDVDRLMEAQPALQKLLKNVFHADGLTPLEREQRRKKTLAAQWSAVKGSDIVSAGKDIVAPGKASFVKKPRNPV